MPVIQIYMTKEDGGLTYPKKQELIQSLTEAFVKVVGRGEKTAVVLLQEVDMDNYGLGGRTIRDIRKGQ